MFWESREASTRVDRGKRTVESVGEGTWQGSGKGGVGSRATPSFPAGYAVEADGRAGCGASSVTLGPIALPRLL